MTDEEIRWKLCSSDKLYPAYEALYSPELLDGDPTPVARLPGCACDGCFRGTDAMAVEVLQAREVVPAMLEALRGMLKYFASYEAEYDCKLSEFAAARAAIQAATVTP